ncbi:hypothetical protein RB595_005096 [Gaeumannomyces hyphopodioides]
MSVVVKPGSRRRSPSDLISLASTDAGIHADVQPNRVMLASLASIDDGIHADVQPNRVMPAIAKPSSPRQSPSDQPVSLASTDDSIPTDVKGSLTWSTSPVKYPDDLLKLEKPVSWKPVSWTTTSPRALRDAVEATGSVQALRLLDNICRVIGGEGYLPREIKGWLLKEDLMGSDSRFTSGNTVVHTSQEDRDVIRQLFPRHIADDEHMLRRFPLRDELNTIRDIVYTTVSFYNIPRSEAAWNDDVHGRILRLAVSGTPHIRAENITQAAIAKAFIPAAHEELETLGGKMVDYALVLRDNDFAARMADFMGRFDEPRTFNQSTYGSLS